MSSDLDLNLPLTVRWKGLVPSEPCVGIISPKFRFLETDWNMYCRSGCYGSGLCATLHIYDSAKEHPQIPFTVSVEVISSCTGRVLPTLSWANHTPEKLTGIAWKMGLNTILLADPGFGRNRQLTFQVTFKEPDPQPDLMPECSTDEASCLKSLSQDFAKLLDEDLDPDVQFQCEDQTVSAHRLVLRVRSPVLESMLQSDMVERRTGVVKIPDMDPDTLKQFVRYLYTGELGNALTFDSAMSLYESGDKYEVKSLAKKCSLFLLENLKIDNACDVLAMADAHSDAELVEAVTQYILKEKIPLSDEIWLDFSDAHPKLAIKVFSRFCKVLSK